MELVLRIIRVRIDRGEVPEVSKMTHKGIPQGIMGMTIATPDRNETFEALLPLLLVRHPRVAVLRGPRRPMGCRQDLLPRVVAAGQGKGIEALVLVMMGEGGFRHEIEAQGLRWIRTFPAIPAEMTDAEVEMMDRDGTTEEIGDDREKGWSMSIATLDGSEVGVPLEIESGIEIGSFIGGELSAQRFMLRGAWVCFVRTGGSAVMLGFLTGRLYR